MKDERIDPLNALVKPDMQVYNEFRGLTEENQTRLQEPHVDNIIGWNAPPRKLPEGKVLICLVLFINLTC